MASSSVRSPEEQVEAIVEGYVQRTQLFDFEDIADDGPVATHRRIVRRARITTLSLTAGLVLVGLLVWLTPPVKHWGPGPTPEQVALQREIARANDLKRQVDELTAKLKQPAPPDQIARAKDLKRQVDELEAKLAVGHPPVTDGVDKARADDLARQVDDLTAQLEQGNPPVTDPSEKARADDLAQQNQALTADLMRPRPPPDPLAGVVPLFTKAQIMQSSRLFGLYTAQAPFNYAEVNMLQSEVNRKANVVGYFQSWKGAFRPDAVKQTWARGQIPLLTWESQPQVGSITSNVPEYSLPKIIGGQYDDYIRQYASDIRALGMPLVLRFDHEMNGTWYPWSETKGASGPGINGNSRGDYVKMWRHVHDIFEQVGANQYVVWLWAPNRINAIPSQPPPNQFYPGDAYVDWIGMSGYYRPYDDAPTFSATHGSTLPLLRQTTRTKPILLAEIGATELNGGKAKWIASLFDNMEKQSDVIGFVWFSLTVTSKHEGQTQTNDWRLDSTPGAVDVAKQRLNSGGWGMPLPPG